MTTPVCGICGSIHVKFVGGHWRCVEHWPKIVKKTG